VREVLSRIITRDTQRKRFNSMSSSFNLPLPSPTRFLHFRKGGQNPVENALGTYLYSFPSSVGLFFFTTTAIALITHKILIIKLHGPFSLWQILFLGPFTFCFDFLTLYLLYRSFRSASAFWSSFASLISFVICACSSTFVSMYCIANAEISWGRSLAVHLLHRF
jgi:hypothetical protein